MSKRTKTKPLLKHQIKIEKARAYKQNLEISKNRWKRGYYTRESLVIEQNNSYYHKAQKLKNIFEKPCLKQNLKKKNKLRLILNKRPKIVPESDI